MNKSHSPGEEPYGALVGSGLPDELGGLLDPMKGCARRAKTAPPEVRLRGTVLKGFVSAMATIMMW